MNQKNNNDNKNEGNKGQNSTKTLKYCNCNGEGHFAKYCKKTKKDKTQMPQFNIMDDTFQEEKEIYLEE